MLHVPDMHRDCWCKRLIFAPFLEPRQHSRAVAMCKRGPATGGWDRHMSEAELGRHANSVIALLSSSFSFSFSASLFPARLVLVPPSCEPGVPANVHVLLCLGCCNLCAHAFSCTRLPPPGSLLTDFQPPTAPSATNLSQMLWAGHELVGRTTTEFLDWLEDQKGQGAVAH